MAVHLVGAAVLRTDIYAPTGAVMVRRGLALRGTLLPSRQRRQTARYLVVTEGALAGARITLSGQPVLIGRADDSTLVLTDDYASTRHARPLSAGIGMVRRGLRIDQRHLP
ncbi:putative fHA domain protein [Mycobacterium kansasii 662]|uniref:Putative fHA domain protein n=1 Tax=Mycobacterium kansasii 662 TaxID=1299326 RepID=X7Z0A8_MYCKA|nr:putative fHA domain protein [Mycobacterium kansasii 662]